MNRMKETRETRLITEPLLKTQTFRRFRKVSAEERQPTYHHTTTTVFHCVDGVFRLMSRPPSLNKVLFIQSTLFHLFGP